MQDSIKTCFIIMPVSDHTDYENGHFKRVYDYIIKPACVKAGFEPLRADDVQKSNIIVVDILHKIVNCEMALCDLSSKNPNVLYELGIRQAFDLPVALIKDNITPRIFDIQGFRDVTYISSMRVDEVNFAIDQIAEAIVATYEQHDTKDNSIISLLSISKASIKEPISLSPETSLMMEMLSSISDKVNKLERSINIIPTNSTSSSENSAQNAENSLGTPIDSFIHEKHTYKIGDTVYHPKFDKGIIAEIRRRHNTTTIDILFDNVGMKTLLPSFAKLSKKPYFTTS